MLSMRGCEKIGTGTSRYPFYTGFSDPRFRASPIFSKPPSSYGVAQPTSISFRSVSTFRNTGCPSAGSRERGSICPEASGRGGAKVGVGWLTGDIAGNGTASHISALRGPHSNVAFRRKSFSLEITTKPVKTQLNNKAVTSRAKKMVECFMR
jgi:hypothetical protein